MDRETADEIKRHFNVVAEGLRSEIRTVAEGLEGLREEVTTGFRAVREELSEVKAMIRLSSESSTAESGRSSPTSPHSEPASRSWNPN